MFLPKPPIIRLVFTTLAGVALAAAGPAGAYQLPAAPPPASDPALQALQQISHGIAQVSTMASKGVVLVSMSKTVKGQGPGSEALPSFPEGADPFEFFFGAPRGHQPGRAPAPRHVEGIGSGFIVDLSQGYVITNNHVVEGADEINLKLANGEHYKGKVVGRDPNTDIAVVKINDKDYKKDGLGALALADSAQAGVGDVVVALGAPFGLETSVSFGVVSATGRGGLDIARIGDFIQTDAAINPGNSGGPLLDAAGQVIGMNTAIYSSSGGYNGIGFAVPSNLVRNVAQELIAHGKIDRGYIGVQLQGLDPDMLGDLKLPAGTGGGLVAHVEKGGPAAKAGLEAGDVITAVDGKALRNETALVNTIGLLPPGKEVKLSYYRSGTKHEAEVKLARYPEQALAREGGGGEGDEQRGDERFGLTLAPVSQELAERYGFTSKHGAVVENAAPNSAAARAGIREGDVLLRVGTTEIKSPDEFYTAAAGKGRVLVQIERRGAFRMAMLSAGRGEG
jgi:serine protease Do